MGVIDRGLLALFCIICTNGWCPPSAQAAPSAAAYRQLGLTYRDQTRYPEAIAAFKQAVALEPDNLSGRVSLGWTLHKAGQGKAAEQTLQETLSFNPFYVPTLNALGIVHLVQGDLSAAVRAHTWALMLKPQNEIAAYNLSLAFERLQEYAAAVTLAEQAAILEPTNPHPLVALAIAQWGQGDRGAAQQAYQRALALDSRYSDAAFLTYLNEAGFSADQIQRTQQVLGTLGRSGQP
jgi:tetratricopeptide (TPR) repeat protein